MDEEGLSSMRWTMRLMIHSDGRKACHELARPKKKTQQFHVTFKQSDLHGVSPVARVHLRSVQHPIVSDHKFERLPEESAASILLGLLLCDTILLMFSSVLILLTR